MKMWSIWRAPWRARLCLAAWLATSISAPALAMNGGSSCELNAGIRERPVPLPRLKRQLARGTDVQILDYGPAFLRRLDDGATDESYPALLQSSLRKSLLHSRINVDSHGGPGETVSAALGQIKADLAGEPPDYAVWRLGPDDALARTPVIKFEAAARQGIGLFRAAGVEVGVVGLPINDSLAEDAQYMALANALAALARDMGATYIPRLPIGLTGARADGLRLNTQDVGLTGYDFGYECLAEQIARSIVEGVRAAR